MKDGHESQRRRRWKSFWHRFKLGTHRHPLFVNVRGRTPEQIADQFSEFIKEIDRQHGK